MTSCRGPICSESTLTISDSTATRIAASMWKITKAVVSQRSWQRLKGSVLKLIVHGIPDARARQLPRSPHGRLDVITEAAVCLVLPVVLAHHRHLTVVNRLVTAKPITRNRVQITNWVAARFRAVAPINLHTTIDDKKITKLIQKRPKYVNCNC